MPKTFFVEFIWRIVSRYLLLYASVTSFPSTMGFLYVKKMCLLTIEGALQYLTLTWPDLSYDVNKACMFLVKPTHVH
jgi:hypothetical protein